MPPKKCHASAPKPPKAPKASKTPRAPKPLKAPQAWESYSQSFQATQYTHDGLTAVVIQPPEALVVILSEDIKEDKFGAVLRPVVKLLRIRQIR